MLWMGQTRKIKSVKVDSVSLLLCGSIEPIAQSNDEAHSKFLMRRFHVGKSNIFRVAVFVS